jgi:hypothetical protein
LVFPATDTIRGGAELVFLVPETELLDTSRDAELLSRTLPAGWGTSVVGSGSVTPSLDGVVLDTGASANSRAVLTVPNTYEAFDVAVDFERLVPSGRAPVPVSLAVLAFQTASGYVRVRVQRGVQTEDGTMVISSEGQTASGITIVGGTTVYGSDTGTLRIVRYGSSVWCFVGTRDSDGEYTELVELMNFGLFDDASVSGDIRIWAENGSVNGSVRTLITNYTVRSHAMIGPRLVDGKIDIGARRLFGVAIGTDDFLYTRPAVLTVGAESANTLITVQDTALKDG